MTPRLLGSILALACAASSGPAAAAPDLAAEPPPDGDATIALEQARQYFTRGQFAAARDVLLRAYERSHRADLLFALGQAEFNLEHFEAAIDYYEQYLATNPEPERAALTQQALGAARARIAAPKPLPPPPPPRTSERHRWRVEYTGLVALGTASIGLGTALMFHGHGLGKDQSGTLAEYDRRITRSETEQLGGLACVIGGGAAIAGALIAWRLKTETVTETVISPRISERAVGLAIGGRW